jgi:hypothetical protein
MLMSADKRLFVRSGAACCYSSLVKLGMREAKKLRGTTLGSDEMSVRLVREAKIKKTIHKTTKQKGRLAPSFATIAAKKRPVHCQSVSAAIDHADGGRSYPTGTNATF